MTQPSSTHEETWPRIPFEAWQDSCATLHLMTQIVGKIRLAQSPWVNHSWHAALYVTPRGLTTSSVPHHRRTFEIAFDFIDHALTIHTSDGRQGAVPLKPQSVALFYRRVMEAMTRLELPVSIHPRPNEVVEAIRFDEDETHAAYDADAVHRYGRALGQADRVLKRFRSSFIGKCSPVHYFWGAPDLAVTRFSGRTAPEHPGGIPNLPDRVAREAYSHEVSSCGFWPGGGPISYPAFYAYAYPEPAGYAEAAVKPEAAFYSQDLKEFILPYNAVRQAPDPDAVLLEFLDSTYAAAAGLAAWDRAALEPGPPRH